MSFPGFSQLLCLSLLLSGAWAQRPPNKQFQWKWANDGIGFSLPTCIPLGIIVQSWNATANNTFGVPPYYMMSFPVGGTPMTTLIGTTNSSLSWTNTHASGSTLLLTIVDSTGSFGGVPPRLFTTIDGVSAQCVVPEPRSPSFTTSSNITGNLQTCQPWGITIHGGIPPYNLSIAAVNSPVVTNVTIPSGFDAFTYINRAEPNGQMIVGVSDFTGRWASGVPLVNTTGSENVECTGLVSSPGVAATLAREAEARRESAGRKHTAVVVGVTVPVVLVLLAAIGGGAWFYLRRKKQKKAEPKTEARPYPYEEEPLTLPTGFYSSSTGFSGSGKGGAGLSMQEHSSSNTASCAVGQNHGPSPSIHGSFAPSSSAYTSQEGHPPPDNIRNTGGHLSTFPTTRPVTGKSTEAAQDVVLAPEEEYGAVASPSGVRRRATDEIVIQHRDGGGAVVRELPPPYADRSRETDES